MLTLCGYNILMGKAMRTFGILFQSLTLLTLIEHVLACHPCGPRSTMAFVNQSTYFNCSTQDLKREIFWYHYPVGVDASGGRLLYRYGKFYNGYTIGFEVEKYRLGDIELYNLVIHNVQLRYAGKYECRDRDGQGSILSAELIVVLESDPKCISDINPSGVIGPNSCGIKPEEIELSCGISYHGNHPPTVQWKSARDNRSISALFIQDISEGQVTYNTTVTAEYDFDGTTFICEIEKVLSSTGQEHSCRTDVVRVLYTFSSPEVLEKNVGDEVICLANTSSGSMCKYRWRWYENEDVLTVSSNETLIIERPGMHRCEATCDIRGKQCLFVASQLKASTVPTTMDITTKGPVGMNNYYWIVAVIVTLLCLFIIMAVLFVIYKRRRKRNYKHNVLLEVNLQESEDNKSTGAKFQNSVILVGIDDGRSITNDVVQFKLHRPKEISFQERVPTKMQRESACAVYDNTIYVTGIGVKMDEIWKYNLTCGWMQCASLVQGRRRHCVAFEDEVLYICGGFVDDDKRVLESVEAYNAISNTCSTVGELVFSIQNSGNCVSFQKVLYIFGGIDKDDNMVNHVQLYDTKHNTCTLLSRPMPWGNNLMRAALWKTLCILIGRFTCFIFDFESQSWMERKQYKSGVVHFGLILENDRVFIVGGGIDEKHGEGKLTWKCRADVRYFSIKDILENNAVEWKIHTKLPKPCLVHAFARIRTKRITIDEHRMTDLSDVGDEDIVEESSTRLGKLGEKVQPSVVQESEDNKSTGNRLKYPIRIDDGQSLELKPLTVEICPIIQGGEIQSLKRKRGDDSSLSEDSHVSVTPPFQGMIKTNDAEKKMKPITGITVLREELFATFEESSNVEVYDAISCNFIDSFDILEMKNPQDVASDERLDCLYVSSFGKIIRIDRNGDLVLFWDTDQRGGCLSVTPESNVLLIIWQSHLLLEYTAEGQILRAITLPSGIHLFHAIKLINSCFIISYAIQTAHNVSMINANGEILSQFGEMVKFPKYLSIYGANECLIVDSQNSRVLIWKSDSSKELLSRKDGLKRPVRIYFHQLSSRIFVADIGEKDHRVVVIKL